jgi:hypothetical protein
MDLLEAAFHPVNSLEQYWKERYSSQFDPEVSTNTILQ